MIQAKTNPMRILFAATNLPIPATNGHAIRTLSIVRALASMGHEVYFTSFVSERRSEDLEPLRSYCRMIELVEREVVTMAERTDYLSRAACLLRGRPYSIERFRSGPMMDKIVNELNKGECDLILSDGIYALVNIPQTKIPIALNTHNVEYVIYKRYFRLEKSLPRKLYASAEAHLVKRAERNSCHRAAVAMACSSIDAEILGRLRPDLHVFVVPNTVDTDFYRPTESNNIQNCRPLLLFQGSMDWYPNRDAVEYFVRDTLPMVRAEIPDVRFVVAGRNPPARFQAELTACGGVEFTGTVPDIRPYLSSATVVVVPLRLGGGTRIKILEACASGKPIVSTRIGAEGLELDDGKDIILADSPSELARAIVALLRDPTRREVIAQSARAVVIERYGNRVLEENMKNVLESVQSRKDGV